MAPSRKTTVLSVSRAHCQKRSVRKPSVKAIEAPRQSME